MPICIAETKLEEGMESLSTDNRFHCYLKIKIGYGKKKKKAKYKRRMNIPTAVASHRYRCMYGDHRQNS